MASTFDLIGALNANLLAAGLPIAGVSGPLAAQGIVALSTFYQRPEGWIKVDWVSAPTTQQNTLASSTVLGLDASAAGQATYLTAQARVTAQALLSDLGNQGVLLRAIVILIVQQLNVLRAAQSPPLTAITEAQARAAILAQIVAGSADT